MSSHTSEESVSILNSVRFRIFDLDEAGVTFHCNLDSAPARVKSLAATLLQLSDSLQTCETVEALTRQLQANLSVSPHELEAFRKLEHPSFNDIERCAMLTEPTWMSDVNGPMFDSFTQARWSGLIGYTQDFLWANAEHLLPLSAERLPECKPDLAYGLTFAQPVEDAGSAAVLGKSNLHALSRNPSVRLCISPSERDDALFPAVIYECKSGLKPMLWAENQAAVGALRSLAVLRDLAGLSGQVDPPAIVTLLTSAGPIWHIHLATWTDGGQRNWKVQMYRINTGYNISSVRDRFRLHVVLLRLREWLLTDHKAWVEDRICRLSQPSDSGRALIE